MNALVLALLLGGPGLAPPATADVSLERLEAELGRLAPAAGGTVGVAALHFESRRRVALRPDERFPMASTYKVPLAVQLLWRAPEAWEKALEAVPADLKKAAAARFDADPRDTSFVR